MSPDEIQGGTFTLSNNGSADGMLTMPIINQPLVAILSTDAIVRKPVVVTSGAGDETIAIHPIGNLAMSWDYRAFDGAYAAGFLVAIKRSLETARLDRRTLSRASVGADYGIHLAFAKVRDRADQGSRAELATPNPWITVV